MSLTVVKSARRVLDILEYFSVTRRPATVSEVEKALDLPQSSTSVLLRSLVALGYLEYLPGERRFRPTLRVAKLGDWVEHGLPGPMTRELEKLRDALQETIILGRRQGAQVQFIYILAAERAVQFHARLNSLQPMALSAVGVTLLSTLPKSTARAIIRRNNAEARSPRYVVDEEQLLSALEDVRRTGSAETDPAFGGPRDFHVVAQRLPRAPGLEPLAVGVGGPRERMLANREAILRVLEEWAATAARGIAHLEAD